MKKTRKKLLRKEDYGRKKGDGDRRSNNEGEEDKMEDGRESENREAEGKKGGDCGKTMNLGGEERKRSYIY